MKYSEQESEKRHNTNETSIEAWKEINQGWTRLKDKQEVYNAILKYQPITSRELVNRTGRERGNICRALYELKGEMIPAIKVAFKDKCPITNKKVEWYCSSEWKPPMLEQGSLPLNTDK